MAELSGAKTIIGKDDAEKASKFFTADILVKDGDELTLGNTTIQFMETPGHTKGCREGYINSLNRLRKEKVDVFIGNHVWNNDTLKKGELLLATGENQFIDDKIWGEFLDFCEQRLNQLIAEGK